MREICSDSSLGVPKGKRVQRQVRYERLKDEFLRLVSKLGSAESTVPQTEEDQNLERADFQQKIGLYKD